MRLKRDNINTLLKRGNINTLDIIRINYIYVYM